MPTLSRIAPVLRDERSAEHRDPPRQPFRQERRLRQLTRPSRLGRGLAAAGLAMIPWLFVLARQLPASTQAWHWRAAWIGLDGMEAAGLLATGVLLIRGDERYRISAAALSALVLTDAWFDVTTAAPGGAQATAIAMAVFPELPVSALCALLALGRPARSAGPPG